MKTNEQLKYQWVEWDRLTEAPWTDLFQLTFSVRQQSNPSVPRSLPDTDENYIQQFFLVKDLSLQSMIVSVLMGFLDSIVISVTFTR